MRGRLPFMKNTLRLLVVSSLGLVAPLALAHDRPEADDGNELTIGARHAFGLNSARFFTNRAAAPLPVPDEAESFVFAVFGDRTGGPAKGVAVLRDAVRDVNYLEPDLVMTVGDLVEGYNTTDPWMKQMEEFKSIMNDLLCPWFPVAGNHDVYWRGPGRPAEEHEAHYEMHFGPLWYAFDHKDCRFIALYSDEGNPDTGERNFNKPECQKMSPEQLAWLAETLASAQDKRHVFVFLHHPRWLKGNYGDDWERVHELLAGAGNVRAVFAGHIHRMRYDGVRDGIEYVTLATVGGVQNGRVPRAGYLHQYHLVTVRPNQIAMTAYPVGEAIDVRALTGEVSDEAARLTRVRPTIETPLPIDVDGRAAGDVTATLTNPTDRPIEVGLSLDADDSRWTFAPDHQHGRIAPGASETFTFRAAREGGGLDETFRLPTIVHHMDYLAERVRYEIPQATTIVPLDPDLPAPSPGGPNRALDVASRRDVLVVPGQLLRVPDGPLTLECWFKPRGWSNRTGLVAKTEYSDYGFFVSKGRPSFYIYLGDAYVAVEPDVQLPLDEWQHLAGVYDGRTVRLFHNGREIGAIEREGPRGMKDFPLMVGADVDAGGRPTSPFNGLIDEVRVSSVARYTEEFTPARRFEPDAETHLLLHLDQTFGPWTPDASPRTAHPAHALAPRLIDVD